MGFEQVGKPRQAHAEVLHRSWQQRARLAADIASLCRVADSWVLEEHPRHSSPLPPASCFVLLRALNPSVGLGVMPKDL